MFHAFPAHSLPVEGEEEAGVSWETGSLSWPCDRREVFLSFCLPICEMGQWYLSLGALF